MRRVIPPLLTAMVVLTLGFACAMDAAADTLGPPAFAGIFGSRDLTVSNPNDPGSDYTMVHHVNDAAGYDALTYDAGRGWGFEVIYPADSPYGGRNGAGIFGPFDDSPNNRNNFSDSLPDQLYDSFIGMKSYLTELQSGTPETPEIGDPPEGGIFRVDVPNGFYRFVGVFGEADNPHANRVLAEDGGSGPPENIGSNYVTLVNNHDQSQFDTGQAKGDSPGSGVFARVGFGDFLPPQPLGDDPAEGIPVFADMDQDGMATDAGSSSPFLEVTEGYIRLHLLQGDSNDGPGGKGGGVNRDANGTDIVLFEVHPVAIPEPATLAMLAAGGLLALGLRMRRRLAG